MLRMVFPKSIILVCFDSPVMLKHVFSNPACLPALVWLDAHWMEGPKLGPECPLLSELAVLAASLVKDKCVILADDARLFINPPPYPHDPSEWPTFDQITEVVKTGFPNHTMRVEGDIIVIAPTAEACQHRWVAKQTPGTPDGPQEWFQVCDLCGAEYEGD
jgi:hypothetical protein